MILHIICVFRYHAIGSAALFHGFS